MYYKPVTKGLKCRIGRLNSHLFLIGKVNFMANRFITLVMREWRFLIKFTQEFSAKLFECKS